MISPMTCGCRMKRRRPPSTLVSTRVSASCGRGWREGGQGGRGEGRRAGEGGGGGGGEQGWSQGWGRSAREVSGGACIAILAIPAAVGNPRTRAPLL